MWLDGVKVLKQKSAASYLILLLGLALELRVHVPRGGIRAQGPAKQQDVGLGPVARVVLPPARLLHTKVAPFDIGKRAVLGQRLGRILRQDNVSVLELAVLVLLRVLNLRGWGDSKSVVGI